MAGRAKVTNNLPQFVTQTERKAAVAMTKALILGGSEASVMTPIDTSTLLNSQYRDVRKEGDAIIGMVGYVVPYAQPVHDPNHVQNFRRESAEKEFLRRGFEKARANIDAVITGAIKT